MISITNTDVALGDWIRLKYGGNPLSTFYVKLDDGSWMPAFYENGEILVRAKANPGQHKVSVRSSNTGAVEVGKINII